MGTSSVSTPTLIRRSQLSVSSPSTPIDFLSPTSQLRRNRPILLSTQSQNGILAENDDATEKQQRQKSRVNALVVQSPVLSPKCTSRQTPNERSVFAPSSQTRLTNVQLKELYSSCLKLSTENKINSKNAFGLQLIDYMQEFLIDMNKDQGMTNFQIASCTLDAGAKIYAGRVDSIHAQAYKMLGGLVRTENPKEDGEDMVDVVGQQKNGDDNTSRKRKTQKSAKIIESNLSNINTDQFDLCFEMDPLFQKLSTTFDEGSTSSLLLNHLGRRDDLCETLFDSKTVQFIHAPVDYSICGTSDIVDSSDMRMRILSLSTRICPQYEDFSFTDVEATNETCTSDRTNESVFDINAPATYESANEVDDMEHDDCDDVMNNDVCNLDNVPDNTINISDNLLGFADGQEAQFLAPGQARCANALTRSDNDLGTFMLSIQSAENAENEYSYSGLPMWAGPVQWKHRAQFDALKGLNKVGAEKKTKTPRKKAFRIDFDESHDFNKLFSKAKGSTVLSKTTIDKHSSEVKTLPDDLHYEMSSLVKLFLKSKLMVRRQFGAQPTMTYEENAENWYNYENENDCANFCPADAQDDDDEVFETGSGPGFNDSSSQEMTQVSGLSSNDTFFHGDNLVSQPNKVQKIEIAYSKTAKKIDVKKVKKAMWDIVMSSTSLEDKENLPENHGCEENVVKESVVKPCRFTMLNNTIPDKISKQMAKNLSVPIAFVCLLHLTNEKNLKLEGKTSMDDFMILQE